MRGGVIGLVLASAVLAGLGSGCTKNTPAPRQGSHIPLPLDTLTYAVDEIGTYGGRFVLAQTAPPRTFNVVMANETSSGDVCDGRLFEQLASYDNGKQEILPSLAKSWESTPDGLTWTFH